MFTQNRKRYRTLKELSRKTGHHDHVDGGNIKNLKTSQFSLQHFQMIRKKISVSPHGQNRRWRRGLLYISTSVWVLQTFWHFIRETHFQMQKGVIYFEMYP